MLLGSGAVIGLLVFLAIVVIFMGVKQVPQGFERFGKYTHTLRPGLAIIIPFIDQIGAKLVMMEQVLDIPSQEVITKDNAMVRVDAVIFFQVVDSARAAYEVRDLERALNNLTLTNIRTVLGSLDLDGALSQRDHINSRLLEVIDEATAPWGIKVTRIEIKDIAPQRDLVESMAAQMKAEREKRAAILSAEGIKQAAVLKARERQAAAEAKATNLVSTAISEGSIQAINYFVAQKYIDVLGKVAAANNQKVILMPLEAASVIGSIAGITEIAKEAFGGKGK